MDKLFTKALSTILVNIAIEPLQSLDEVEVCLYACLTFLGFLFPFDSVKLMPKTETVTCDYNNRYTLQIFRI